MFQFFKNLFVSIVVLVQFFDCVQPVQGTLSHNDFEKPFKISLMSKDFLQKSVQFQQDFLAQRQACQLPDAPCVQVIQSMLQLNQQVLQTQEISSKVQSDLFSMVNLARQTLFEQQAPTFCDLRDQAFKSWWNFLERSLDHVQVQGYQQDFAWLCTQVAQLIYAFQLNIDSDQLKKTTIHCVTLCQDLMHKFNGLFINDYDLLVLGNVAVVLLAMRC